MNEPTNPLAERLRKMQADIIRIPDWMVVDAVRYALGRATYQVSVTCQWLREQWPSLPESTRQQISRDIEQEFVRAEAAGGMIGMACDHREWERIRALYAAPEPVIDLSQIFDRKMVVCDTCGNKRCPGVNGHPCTGSNAPGQPGSNFQ